MTDARPAAPAKGSPVVTNFFRDPLACEALATQALPALINEALRGGHDFRGWVVGCATGEEAFSIAMLLAERLEAMQERPRTRLFATDIDERSIHLARQGLYPMSIAADVSPGRLGRFFDADGEHVRVRKSLREMVMFAVHDVLRDPPFSRLDFISCRNLLVHLDPQMQEHVLETFHFALRPGGTLFLGAAEKGESAAAYFSEVDKRNRIYRSDAVARMPRRMPLPVISAARAEKGWHRTEVEAARESSDELQAMVEELRSTTEELETSNDELQSINQQLLGVNRELKLQAQARFNAVDDLRNLVSASGLAAIIVDRTMAIRRFTPRATSLFNLIDADVGRPLSDITHCFGAAPLAQDAMQAFRSLRELERNVQSDDGRPYLARIAPYRTSDNRIDGVVLAFMAYERGATDAPDDDRDN